MKRTLLSILGASIFSLVLACGGNDSSTDENLSSPIEEEVAGGEGEAATATPETSTPETSTPETSTPETSDVTDTATTDGALCPGVAAAFEAEIGGADFKASFIGGCQRNPLCEGSALLVQVDDCAKTINTIKALSADFRDVCENGPSDSGDPETASDVPGVNEECKQSCEDLFLCATNN